MSIPQNLLVLDAPQEYAPNALKRVGANEGQYHVAVNVPLIRTASDVILVDIGAGHRYQSLEGSLAENLARAGVLASEVTKVVMTHAQPDHIWATVAQDGQLRYRNATYFIGSTEWDFWTDLGNRTIAFSSE